jgi:hypothetical protein
LYLFHIKKSELVFKNILLLIINNKTLNMPRFSRNTNRQFNNNTSAIKSKEVLKIIEQYHELRNNDAKFNKYFLKIDLEAAGKRNRSATMEQHKVLYCDPVDIVVDIKTGKTRPCIVDHRPFATRSKIRIKTDMQDAKKIKGLEFSSRIETFTYIDDNDNEESISAKDCICNPENARKWKEAYVGIKMEDENIYQGHPQYDIAKREFAKSAVCELEHQMVEFGLSDEISRILNSKKIKLQARKCGVSESLSSSKVRSTNIQFSRRLTPEEEKAKLAEMDENDDVDLDNLVPLAEPMIKHHFTYAPSKNNNGRPSIWCQFYDLNKPTTKNGKRVYGYANFPPDSKNPITKDNITNAITPMSLAKIKTKYNLCFHPQGVSFKGTVKSMSYRRRIPSKQEGEVLSDDDEDVISGAIGNFGYSDVGQKQEENIVEAKTATTTDINDMFDGEDDASDYDEPENTQIQI